MIVSGKLLDGRRGQYPTLHTDLYRTRWRFDKIISKPSQKVHRGFARLYMLA